MRKFTFPFVVGVGKDFSPLEAEKGAGRFKRKQASGKVPTNAVHCFL